MECKIPVTGTKDAKGKGRGASIRPSIFPFSKEASGMGSGVFLLDPDPVVLIYSSQQDKKIEMTRPLELWNHGRSFLLRIQEDRKWQKYLTFSR
jgi:hypothetical protein